MRVLTASSRDWEGIAAEARVQQVLDAVHALCVVLGQKLTVVHGGCPTGGDQCVDRWCRRREDEGVTVEVHEADWKRYGKAAGPRRNQDMVDRGADLCIGFLRNNSTGTRNTLALARYARIGTFTVHWGA